MSTAATRSPSASAPSCQCGRADEHLSSILPPRSGHPSGISSARPWAAASGTRKPRAGRANATLHYAHQSSQRAHPSPDTRRIFWRVRPRRVGENPVFASCAIGWISIRS
jgi:hypothetical protein